MMNKLQNKFIFLIIQCFITFFILILGIFIYGKIFGPISISINEQVPKRTFEVEGTGKTTVVPNVFQIEFSVNETGSTQKEAQNKGNDKLDKAISELISIGISKKDIQTIGYYVNPNYDFTEGRRITGYSININTSVKSKNIDKINKSLDKLIELGINVGGINYTVEDEESYKSKARQLAVDDARKKAQDFAKATGFKLGKIASIKEVTEPRILPTLAKSTISQVEGGGTNIQPGSTDITSKITISYYIED